MSLSKETQQSIDIAYKYMTKNAENAISYYYRWKIYETFTLNNRQQGEKIFKRLAIISARYVLPIWQNVQPSDKRPENLLDMAEGFLEGTVPIDVMRKEADAFWDYMEKLGSTPKALLLGNACYVGESVAEAAMEVLGKIPYEGVIINESETDLFLDVWVGDTAFWAANAFAGRFGDSKTDHEKTKVFWTWWLKEAILSAHKEG